jgi:hypothetical protein
MKIIIIIIIIIILIWSEHKTVTIRTLHCDVILVLRIEVCQYGRQNMKSKNVCVRIIFSYIIITIIII